MKAFIFKGLFLSVLGVALLFFAQWRLSKKFVDENYPKFTHKAGSLILGISRAHDGVVPKVLKDSLLHHQIDTPIVNFAFQLSQSPYGPVYFDAVKKKVNDDVKNGIFILSVNYSSLAIPEYLPDSAEVFSDRHSILAKVGNLNSKPNYEYIRKSFGKALYKAFLDPKLGIRTVHEDGWIEVDLNSRTYNVKPKEIESWKNQVLKSYIKHKDFYKFSHVRYRSLDDIIKYLKPFGHVFLVRLPADGEIIEMENLQFPELDSLIDRLAIDNNVPYLNYAISGAEYETYDGTHLSKTGAIQFTQDLARDINKLLSPDLYVKTSAREK